MFIFLNKSFYFFELQLLHLQNKGSSQDHFQVKKPPGLWHDSLWTKSTRKGPRDSTGVLTSLSSSPASMYLKEAVFIDGVVWRKLLKNFICLALCSLVLKLVAILSMVIQSAYKSTWCGWRRTDYDHKQEFHLSPYLAQRHLFKFITGVKNGFFQRLVKIKHNVHKSVGVVDTNNGSVAIAVTTERVWSHLDAVCSTRGFPLWKRMITFSIRKKKKKPTVLLKAGDEASWVEGLNGSLESVPSIPEYLARWSSQPSTLAKNMEMESTID